MSDAQIYKFPVKTLAGEKTTLAAYEGKVMLVVNTASKCGFTPQYAGLEKLHKDLGPEGLVVLGFPCNQFGKQEPGNAATITEFCELNYGVSFPMFSKIDVNGAGAHPLYKYLKDAAPGILGTKAIKWNFTKFLVDKTGKVVDRFASKVKPAALEGPIRDLL